MLKRTNQVTELQVQTAFESGPDWEAAYDSTESILDRLCVVFNDNEYNQTMTKIELVEYVLANPDRSDVWCSYIKGVTK